MRVVSWAVVGCPCYTTLSSPHEGAYELLGTMTGTLQIGAAVNEGEQVAEWEKMPQSQYPWSTSLAQKELLQLLDQG